ncbi:hypothetical protein PV646_09915 [Streptomyces sp. ID05-26A]|nr:hypothetical protein [Streptomyces sp. ID05-26A]
MRRLSVVLVGTLVLVGVQTTAAQAQPAPAAQQAVDEGTTFVPMAPRRVLDTRNGTGNGGSTQPVEHGLQLNLSGTLPATATAVVLNLTGTQPTADTYIRVSPVNYNVPNISNLNLVTGETRANQVTVPVAADQKIYLFNNVGTTHLIADVAGYYTRDTTGARFATTPPTRVIDTRQTSAVGPGASIDVSLAALLPSSARSVTFNLTGTEPTASTHVTAHPTGSPRPDASSLNLSPGQTSPNLVTVSLGTDRKVTLYNNLGNTHLIVDVVGYYATDRGHRFFPVAPVRTYDTRTETAGPPGPGQSRAVDLAKRIAPTAAAAVLNLTAAAPTSDSFITAHSSNIARPATSNLNLTAGRDTANGAVVALQNDAWINLYNNQGRTELIVDIAGFFGTPAPCEADCLYGWGGYETGYGPTPARRPWLSGITSVDTSAYNTLALKSDGTVWSWGENGYGQLGTGGTGGRSTVPLRVHALTGVTAVAAGTWTNYALKSDGTVWAWGWNEARQLGTEYSGDSNTPLQVYGLTGVTAIAASHQGAYALKSDGTVWAWGNDVWGGRGNGTCPTGYVCPPGTPLKVALPLPGGTKITAIAAGSSETGYALRSDGTAWAWGRNWAGETGTGAPPRSSVSPTQVVGLTGVVSIAGGDEVGYATTSDGKVWAWGNDYWGVLGTGTSCADPEFCKSNVPVEVKGLTGPVTIESGGGTTLAVKPDGSVWAWGRNDDAGNLGNGTTDTCNEFPLTPACRASTPVRTTISGVRDVAASGFGMYAVVQG